MKKLSFLTFDNDSSPTPSVATIGFFDGVHIGHRHLIEQMKGIARENGRRAVVVTFDRQPRQVLQPDFRPQLLTTLDEKRALLMQTGIDDCIVLPFTKELAAMTARDFMREVLRERLNVETLVTGYDNRFGHSRSEGFDDYVAYGSEMGMTVVSGTPVETGGAKVSSSRIRHCLTEGNIAEANACLGRCYELAGDIVHGRGVGHKMDYPTANLLPDDNHKLIPAAGVYAVSTCIDNDGQWHDGMTNIGHRPTFDDGAVTIETNLFDFDSELYGHSMRLRIVARLRDERRFASPEELIEQLRRDEMEARRLLGTDGCHNE